jgi:hypothetical protein
MGGAATPQLEVGDGPDGRVPPASDRPQKGEGGCSAGPTGESKLGRCGLPAHTGKGRWPENLRGLKEERGWAGLRRE